MCGFADVTGGAGVDAGDAPKKIDDIFVEERIRNKPNFTYKMKIIISFFQIATNLSFQVEVPWPSYYRRFISIFTFFTLDFVPWQSVGCVTLLDYYAKLLVVTVTPVVIFILLILLFLVPMYYLDRRDMRDDASLRAAHKRSRRKFWKLVLFTVFLLYPNVSSTVLGFFVCKNVAGE